MNQTLREAEVEDGGNVVQKMMTTSHTPTVQVSLTFLLRSLEWAKEEAVDDIALHQYIDGIYAVGLGGHTLEMEDYTLALSYVRSGKNSSEPESEPPKPTSPYADPPPSPPPAKGGNGVGTAAAAGVLGVLARLFAQESVGDAITRIAAGENPDLVCHRLNQGELGEGELSGDSRKKLPDSAFAGPGRSYPIHDLTHARAALAMSAGARSGKPASETVQARVRSAVYARYPQLKNGSKKD